MPIEKKNLSTELQTEIELGKGFASVFGTTYYVDSNGTNAGDTTAHGKTIAFPFATLDYAIGQCTAGKGDVIVVAALHAEVIGADGLTIDVDDITIIGLGHGATRPTFTLTPALQTDDVVIISADDCLLQNLSFTPGLETINDQIQVTGSNVTIRGCQIAQNASYQSDTMLTLDGANPIVEHCEFDGTDAGAQQAIELKTATASGAIIRNNIIYGDFSLAGIQNPASAVCTWIHIHDNIITNVNAGEPAIELLSACTGVIARNIVNCPLAAVGTLGAIDPGSCHCVENYGSDGVGDVSGLLNPAADAP